MTQENVLLIGGSGFLGSHLAHQLAARGCRITVPTRRRERAKHLLPLPTVDVVEADVHDPATLSRLIPGRDLVVNLVGILTSRNGAPYGPDFAEAHVKLPHAIATVCRNAGVPRLLHVSALKADKTAPSQYLRSKADGEAAIRQAGEGVATTIFRPSVIFGPGDSFLNLFASLAGFMPMLVVGCPKARFQPVYVEDVVASMVASLDRADSYGAAYDLCGPTVYTLEQLVDYACRTADRPRLVVGLPKPLAYLQAFALEKLPGKLMTRDNVASMQIDSVCGECALPFGRIPTPLESVAPVYLGNQTPRARYMPIRTKAHR